MNILYILGNGFDINLGMETRYSNFYSYYVAKKSENQALVKLKKEIEKNIENWSDFELAFGQYTNSIEKDCFFSIYQDILQELSHFLRNEIDKIDWESINKQRLYLDLINPENYLEFAFKKKIENFKFQRNDRDWLVDIVTFNYTDTIEKAINWKNQRINLGEHFKNSSNISRCTYLNEILHIHGDLNERMIFGVNDEKQIGNTEYLNDKGIINAFVKSVRNKNSGYAVDDFFQSKINNAVLICLFGTSIGQSDKIWWELIGERVKNGMHLIIFDYCEEIDKKFDYQFHARRVAVKERFLELSNVDREYWEGAFEYIHVAVNTAMFNLNESLTSY